MNFNLLYSKDLKKPAVKGIEETNNKLTAKKKYKRQKDILTTKLSELESASKEYTDLAWRWQDLKDAVITLDGLQASPSFNLNKQLETVYPSDETRRFQLRDYLRGFFHGDWNKLDEDNYQKNLNDAFRDASLNLSKVRDQIGDIHKEIDYYKNLLEETNQVLEDLFSST